MHAVGLVDNGTVPPSWRESIIVHIHKIGPKEDRFISLISSISKIFVNILNKRLTTWCDEHKIVHESQAGFRRHYYTVDNIFNLQAAIQKFLCKRRGRLYVFYIDCFKAFDSCIYQNLWNCLVRKGINENR